MPLLLLFDAPVGVVTNICTSAGQVVGDNTNEGKYQRTQDNTNEGKTTPTKAVINALPAS
ncbi:hypothetical protein [Dyadobacter aurulentus]|uniref:hypothetical protein n=1 Tax=Dyadobacter sp. UC 10 TaxID=2605428 RepID=UPI0011F1EF07|nr:hypothetical protein [Dyadobacter sp. UC 10]KAA0993195.1 hypothetical protein FXO21_24965 [Dyadobacter sp. UC 10]